MLFSWRRVEIFLSKTYGYTPRQISKLSWRRLRLLVLDEFTVEQLPVAASSQPRVNAPVEDWQAALDRAIGREAPAHRQQMDLHEFMGMMK